RFKSSVPGFSKNDSISFFSTRPIGCLLTSVPIEVHFSFTRGSLPTSESITTGFRWQTRVVPDGEVKVVVGFSAPGSLNEEAEGGKMWLGRGGARLGGL